MSYHTQHHRTGEGQHFETFSYEGSKPAGFVRGLIAGCIVTAIPFIYYIAWFSG